MTIAPLFDLISPDVGTLPPDGGGELVDPGFSVTPLPNGWILAGIIALAMIVAFVLYRVLNKKKQKS